MDEIRAGIQRMQTEECAGETAATADSENVARQAILLRAFGGIFTVGLVILANVAIIRELRQRQLTEAALSRQYRDAEAAR